jgi:hypothetical protein
MCGGILVWTMLAASGAGGREPVETAAARARAPARHGDLAATLPVLHGTLRLVRDKYVDPTRIVPRDLFVGALRQLERELVPVVVSRDDATGVVVVSAGGHATSFALSGVQGLWDVAAPLQEVFGFLGSALQSHAPIDLRSPETARRPGRTPRVRVAQSWSGFFATTNATVFSAPTSRSVASTKPASFISLKMVSRL